MNELGPMKILLTGGTGFFGKALLRHHLLSKASVLHEIDIISRNPDIFLAKYPELCKCKSLRLLKGDIQEPSSLPWSDSYSHILHAATDSTLGHRLTPVQRFQQIVDGTRNILDLALATGAKRFLLTSSGSVYGPQPSSLKAFSEDWHGSPSLSNPLNAYAQGKRFAEHLCTLYHNAHGIEVVIARCFTFAGPDLPIDAHFAIGNFIRDALTAENIEVKGDGSALRTYLDQRDLAHWLYTMLERGQPNEAYNVGSDEVISIRDLANLVRDIVAPSKPVRLLHGTISNNGRNRYIPDISKAEKDLGLSPSVKVAEAIKNTALDLQARVKAAGG